MSSQDMMDFALRYRSKFPAFNEKARDEIIAGFFI